MSRLRTLLPVVAATTVFIALANASVHPSRLIVVMPVIGGVALVSAAVLCLSALMRKTALLPGALPALLIMSMSFADFFIEDQTLRIAVAAVGSVLFYILIRHLAEAVRTGGYPEVLSALSEWSAVLIVFTAASGLLAAVTFLGFPAWSASSFFTVIAVFLSVTLARVSSTGRSVMTLAVALFLAEGFALVTFLPLSYWVSGGVLAAEAYLLFALSRNVSARELKRSIVTASAMSILLLATAKWR